jgi:uncharacterized protein (DUF2147 family)
MKRIAPLLFAFFTCTGYAQSISGTWMTIDDKTGKQRSIVEIFERNGKVFGKIIKIFPAVGEEPDPVCDECPEDDARYKKKIIGMEIIKDMEKSGDEYAAGNILDPEEGKVYKCKLWLEGTELKVRGYWGPFYRTQTWTRSN